MRRWWLIGALIVVGGGACTVASSWWIALLPGSAVGQARGAPQQTWIFKPPVTWPDRPDASTTDRGHVASLGVANVMLVDDQGITGLLQTEWSYGWPLRSLCVRNQGEKSLGPDRELSIVGVTWLDRGLRVRGQTLDSDRLPIRPLLGGFVVNSLIASFTIAIVLSVVGPARRRFFRDLRLARGLCGGCGYEIGNLVVCPECGTGRP